MINLILQEEDPTKYPEEALNPNKNKIELGLIDIYNSVGKSVPSNHGTILNNIYNSLYNESI